MYLLQTVSQSVPRKVMDPPEDNSKRRSKWTLGSIFRRRKKHADSSDSSSDNETKPKSFLGKRRTSRREKKNTESVSGRSQSRDSVKQRSPFGGSANSLGGSSEGFGSHGSLTRKDRREFFKARVEATRRDSSSDDESPNPHPGLSRFKSDDSLMGSNRRSRAARTERYMKRVSKDEESLNQHSLSKSDVEIHAPHQNWAATVVYRESPAYPVRPVSASPSPVTSPRTQHRVLFPTFPPQASPQMQRAQLGGRRSYAEPPRDFQPAGLRSTSYGSNIHIASNTNGLPSPSAYFYAPLHAIPYRSSSSTHVPPPPPPRDPMRKFLMYNGASEFPVQQVPNSAFHRSRSDHIIAQRFSSEPMHAAMPQGPYQYLADQTPRSRRPIHVVPVSQHEPSPECIMPSPPPWLNVNIPPEQTQNSIFSREISASPIEMRQKSRLSSVESSRKKSITPQSQEDAFNKTPPPPPVRRYSRQSSVSSIDDEPKRHSSNLEEALNELEAIYQSLRLGDEDLLDRAERRDLPTVHQQLRQEPLRNESNNDGVVLRRKNRAPPNRRSGIPDLEKDDMAYRRLNPSTPSISKERQSGSYLLMSPTLSPQPSTPPGPDEPDPTLDDMSYRALKNASSLRVIEPQPPFGIPLTPASPAPGSDYLHAKPVEKYRPTFRPRRTPDVVKDDLAFRNLRKDSTRREMAGENVRKKRAVRSLSANLMNLMETQDQDIEKTQSLTDLPDALQVLLEGKELTSDTPVAAFSRPPPSWVERASLLDTSTETLTESRANLRSLRNSLHDESRPMSLFIPERRATPIKEQEPSSPALPFDEEKLEELLSALAKEAHDTSERLGRELERLRDGSRSVEEIDDPPTFALSQGEPLELRTKESDNLMLASANVANVFVPFVALTTASECELNHRKPDELNENFDTNLYESCVTLDVLELNDPEKKSEASDLKQSKKINYPSITVSKSHGVDCGMQTLDMNDIETKMNAEFDNTLTLQSASNIENNASRKNDSIHLELNNNEEITITLNQLCSTDEMACPEDLNNNDKIPLTVHFTVNTDSIVKIKDLSHISDQYPELTVEEKVSNLSLEPYNSDRESKLSVDSNISPNLHLSVEMAPEIEKSENVFDVHIKENPSAKLETINEITFELEVQTDSECETNTEKCNENDFLVESENESDFSSKKKIIALATDEFETSHYSSTPSESEVHINEKSESIALQNLHDTCPNNGCESIAEEESNDSEVTVIANTLNSEMQMNAALALTRNGLDDADMHDISSLEQDSSPEVDQQIAAEAELRELNPDQDSKDLPESISDVTKGGNQGFTGYGAVEKTTAAPVAQQLRSRVSSSNGGGGSNRRDSCELPGNSLFTALHPPGTRSPGLSAFHVPVPCEKMSVQLRTSERAKTRALNTTNSSLPTEEQQRRTERIARYKEDRRKQLAAQYGGNDSSSGAGTDSPVPTSATRKRFISRDEKSSIPQEPLRNIRSTRASRLRAAASTSSPPTIVDGAAAAAAVVARSSAEPKSRLTRRSTVASPCDTSSSAASSDVNSREGTPRYMSASSRSSSVAIKPEKDKSGKRKSNLNRALTEEPAPSSDSTTDDNSSRRRKSSRTSNMGAGCGAPTARGLSTCLPQRTSPAPAPPAAPPVFQRLLCNVRGVPQQRTSPTPRALERNNGSADVSRRVDALMARTKEYEARIDRLASVKKPIKLTPEPLKSSRPIKPLSKDKMPVKMTETMAQTTKENVEPTAMNGSHTEIQPRDEMMNSLENNIPPEVLPLADLPQRVPVNNLVHELTGFKSPVEVPFSKPSSPIKRPNEFPSPIKNTTQSSSPIVQRSSSKSPIKSPIKSPSKSPMQLASPIRVNTSKSSSKPAQSKSPVMSPVKSMAMAKPTPIRSPVSSNSQSVSPVKLKTLESGISKLASNDKSPGQSSSTESPTQIIQSPVLPTSSASPEDIFCSSSSPVSNGVEHAEDFNDLPVNIDDLNLADLELPPLELPPMMLENQLSVSPTPPSSPRKNSGPNSPTKFSSDEIPKRRSSILKKKSVEESCAPVSILKHNVKEEVPASVIIVAPDSPETTRPQSILKKRASLEESSDRRCGSRSPELLEDDSGILRRRSSREDLDERPYSPEPQGILKRKSNSVGETARPILKKKSSSEELDEPRPILKKKASTDEEIDESKPRPILKSGRRSVEDRGEDSPSYSSATASPARRSPLMVEDMIRVPGSAMHLRFSADEEEEDEDEEDDAPTVTLRLPEPSCSGQNMSGAESPAVREDDEEEEEEQEERRPSVSERAQLFMRLSELQEHVSPLPRPREARRERAKRFSTQPVTSEEVDEARGQLETQNQPSTSETQQAHASLSALQPGAPAGGDTDDEDEPSQLTLAERVQLFNQKIQQASPARSVNAGPPPVRRTIRRAVTSTRFRTLPVTEAEVQQVSPLAASLAKPPDPGVLGGMSARAARDAMFEHAAKVLAPRPSSSDLDISAVSDPRPKGILKHSSSVPPVSKPPPSPPTIPKVVEETEVVRGILKIPASVVAQARMRAGPPITTTNAATITTTNTAVNSNVKSVLKKESSFDELAPRSILKPQSLEWSESSSSEEDAGGDVRGGDLASILNSVATSVSQPTSVAVSSDEGDTSSSGGREVKHIIGIVQERSVNVIASINTTSTSATQQTGPSSSSSAKAAAAAAALPGSTLATGKPTQAGVNPTGKAVVPQQPLPGKTIQLTSGNTIQLASSISSKFTGKSVPVEGIPASSGPQRSRTQPITGTKDKNTMSIAERLAALKQSGESEWKKRVSRLSPEREICTNGNSKHNSRCDMDMRAPQPLQTSASMPGSAKGILAEKLNLLDAASNDWKKRVGPNDAIEFSVAGRMGLPDSSPPSPIILASDRKKKTPKPARFKSKTGSSENKSMPSSPQKDLSHALMRSISAPEPHPDSIQTVEVPNPNNETFTAFFESLHPSEPAPNEQVDIGDFEHLASSQHTLLQVYKRTVKMQRRRIGSRNPIKALAARTDLVQEYQEVRTGAAEREMKRLNVEKLAKNSNLAIEALAGLASKEDFTAVALKKATAAPLGPLLPYSNLMLLQVKGRRHVQTRLVEPISASINHGDSYVLVTPSEVYNWVGKYSNVIERSRSAEVAAHVAQKKDLGCSKAGAVVTLNESKVTCSGLHRRAFWKHLGVEDGESQALTAGHPDEDESYEMSVTDTNMVYTVEGDELVPLEDFWGVLPRIEMLDPNKVLVFDFGSELYVWNGKNAATEARRAGITLAQELWEANFDYSECEISPLSEVVGQRPPWALLGKLNQHMETILFREKFLDWPEFSRVIRVKEDEDDGKQVDGSIDVTPCDVTEMVKSNDSDPDLELEGSHLGRGDSYFDQESLRRYEVATTSVTVWHVEEFGCRELPPECVGQFHEGDSYVVRWSYSLTVTGRELSGAPSKHQMVGRNRCAYFCWQGAAASLNEQGAAALLTVELDRERGPQVRVVQEMEPAAFLRLFSGGMVVHSGRREEETPDTGAWRLFLSRVGAHQLEACLIQVACSVRQLRSRTSLLLVNIKTGSAYLWHGVQSPASVKKSTLEAVNKLAASPPLEFCLLAGVKMQVSEIKEGCEPDEFFAGLGGNSRQLYVSLLGAPTTLHPVRLFHLSSASGTFIATEVLCASRCKDPPLAYPFLQKELYEASQPALFMLDAGPELWLWQGWWPDEGGEEAAGSGAVRWQAERRAAMHTAQEYWASRHKLANQAEVPLRASLVWAGLEPLAFTNLFPHWQDRDDAAECNIQDGHKPGEVLNVEAELARLTRSTYPPAQLIQRPLPDGVDPTRLEDYLAPQHFQELLGMAKEDFLELPSWKQTNVKKAVGLF